MVGTKMVKQPSLGPLSPPRYQLTRRHSTAKLTFYELENVTEMAIHSFHCGEPILVSASPSNSLRDTLFSAIENKIQTRGHIIP